MHAQPRQHSRRWGRVIAVVVVGALLGSVIMHAYAQSLEERARDRSLPPAERVDAGQSAVSIEPWNAHFRLSLAIARAQHLLAQGRVDEAYFVLLPYTQVRDEQLRYTYQDVLAQKWPLDARKAHQQHAKEATGGALAPEDVFK